MWKQLKLDNKPVKPATAPSNSHTLLTDTDSGMAQAAEALKQLLPPQPNCKYFYVCMLSQRYRCNSNAE